MEEVRSFNVGCGEGGRRPHRWDLIPRRRLPRGDLPPSDRQIVSSRQPATFAIATVAKSSQQSATCAKATVANSSQ